MSRSTRPDASPWRIDHRRGPRTTGQINEACGDRAPRGFPGMPCSQERRPATICPRRTIRRHTTQKQQFDALIHYPYHPRVGERVIVLRTVHHGGVLHFVIDSADGTRGLLPEWMTEPHAAALQLVESATLSFAALRDLRATIDGRLLSSATLSSTQEIGSHVGATPESPTRPSTSGSIVGRPRQAAARGSSGSPGSVEATSERMRPGRDKDEVGR